MKKTLMVAGLAGVLASANSKAATIALDNVIVGSSQIVMPTHMQNTDSGAVYNSAESNVFSSVANDLYALNDSAYSSVSDLIGSWNKNITGEVSNGWTATGTNTGSVGLTNDGSTFLGVPTYDVWQNSSNNPSQDEMSLSLGIPINQLDTNNNSTYDPFNLADIASSAWNPADYDPIVVLTGTPEANDFFNASNYNGTVPASSINNAFVGSDGGFSTWEANGPQYALVNPNDFSVIPEPSTTGLLGLGLAAGLLYRRRENALRVSFRDTGAATSGSQAA